MGMAFEKTPCQFAIPMERGIGCRPVQIPTTSQNYYVTTLQQQAARPHLSELAMCFKLSQTGGLRQDKSMKGHDYQGQSDRRGTLSCLDRQGDQSLNVNDH